MFALFKSPPLVDEASARWMGTIFDWALTQFDAPFFHEQTPLVLPDNTHFPGRADSVEAMAANLLTHTLRHSGLAHWRCVAVDGRTLEALPPSPLQPAQAARQQPRPPSVETPALPVPYDPAQVNDPQTLVASYATLLGHYLGLLAAEPPPASPEQQPLVAELLGIYLGFGVMLTNSAFAFRGGCGGCRRPGHQRTAYLSQDEAIYALALFCRLKQIPAKQVQPHLKKHLRGLYKKACRTLPPV